MARTANPDKPKIDALRAEGKILVHAIKEGNKAHKKLAGINAKLVKFDTAEIPVPEAPAVTPTKAKTPAKVAAKKAAPVAKEKPKLAKGTKGKSSVTTAPKKRGRPAKADSDLDFD